MTMTGSRVGAGCDSTIWTGSGAGSFSTMAGGGAGGAGDWGSTLTSVVVAGGGGDCSPTSTGWAGAGQQPLDLGLRGLRMRPIAVSLKKRMPPRR